MKYAGEHLLPGQLGEFLVVLSFVASLVATIAYFKSTNALQPAAVASWKKMARIAFIIDAVAIFSVFILIYVIIAGHYFEYYYAWNHSDKSLRPKYLLSSIWEGQEGSFLLWTFWHAVIGSVLIRTSGKWEAPVMTVLSFAQFCLATMIAGIYIFNLKLGSNPFVLLRHTELLSPDSAPFLFDKGALHPNYLEAIYTRGGIGLNQLLQNYWMVIHPPILFLGFASTIVPFAFAMAGLWKKDYGWTKVSLPWSLFSGGILSLGIMMGAKWAYESLNFGGYWAWDPVENASLVPWLLIVAGIHTQVIYNATGHSLRAAHTFFILGFLLILYSTYLTRSGDLQDTSVHAFVDSGMNWQLRAFVMVFLLPSAALLISRYRQVPHIAKEESSWSREFWMFIGSLVLFLSAMAIIVGTSLPVINKIFKTNFAIGADPEFSYNRIQVFIAIILGILTAVTQYLKYKSTNKSQFLKKIAPPTLIAVAASALASAFGNIHYDKYGIGFLIAIHLAVFAGIYSAVANAAYIWLGLRGKLKAAGASVAHFGFAIMLVGILISSAKKEVLSVNTLNPVNFGPDAKEKGEENLTLFQGIRTDMGTHWATYVKDTATENGTNTFFHILMEDKKTHEQFVLYPDAIKNTKGQQGYSMNPDARHYWNKDIFSYVSYSDKMVEGEDTSAFRHVRAALKDTIYYSNGYMILDTVAVNPENPRVQFKDRDTAIMATLTVISRDHRKLRAQPFFYFRRTSMQIETVPDTVISQGLAVSLERIFTNDRKFEIGIRESSRLTPFVTLKVLVFPFINLVWLGVIIMVVGFVMSMVRRIKLL